MLFFFFFLIRLSLLYHIVFCAIVALECLYFVTHLASFLALFVQFSWVFVAVGLWIYFFLQWFRLFLYKLLKIYVYSGSWFSLALYGAYLLSLAGCFDMFLSFSGYCWFHRKIYLFALLSFFYFLMLSFLVR